MQPQKPRQRFSSDVPFIKIDAGSTEVTVTNATPNNNEEEEEDDDGTAQLVSNLRQMDLLSLVLDLLERVMGGTVTAKMVDNEAGSIRSRIRVAKTWLQQLEQGGIAGAAVGAANGVSVVGPPEVAGVATAGRRDVYEEIEYLESMIESKRDLLLRFKSVMGEEDNDLMQMDDSIQQQDEEELDQQQQPQQSLLALDGQSESLEKTQQPTGPSQQQEQHNPLQQQEQHNPLQQQERHQEEQQQQQQLEGQQQQPIDQLTSTGFVSDVIGNFDGAVPNIHVNQPQQPDISQQSSQQQQNSLQPLSQKQKSKQEQSLQQDFPQQDPQDVSMLDDLGLENFEDSNFNFDF